jgi:hypothetical protein
VAIEGAKQRKLGMNWAGVQMRQIYTDYSIAISPRDITLEEIRFFYTPLIEGLCKMQKDLKHGKQIRH